MKTAYITDGDNYTFFVLDGGNLKQEIINKDDWRLTTVLKAINEGNDDLLVETLSKSKEEAKVDIVKEVIKEFDEISIRIIENKTENTCECAEVLFKGTPVPSKLKSIFFKLFEDGCTDFTGYINFLKNIDANPSKTSREELYDFLATSTMPITEQGTFIAYKGLSEDMYSVTGNTKTRVLKGVVDNKGRILNTIGEEIEVARQDVDSDRNRDCSYGLHVGSYSYADSFGVVLVAVEVNPKDVVSVPTDCSCQKCRVCKYKVLNIVNNEFKYMEAEVDNETNNVSCKPSGSIVRNKSYEDLVSEGIIGDIEEAVLKLVKLREANNSKVTIRELVKNSKAIRRFKLSISDMFNILLHSDNFTIENKAGECLGNLEVSYVG